MHSDFSMVSPEQKGLSSENIVTFYQQIYTKNLPLHSAILYVDGAVVSKTYYAPVKEGELHRMFSIAKTMSALAIGLLVDQGKLSLSDRIVDFFPEKLPAQVHPYLAQMTIRNMLMMRTCYTRSSYNKFDFTSDWVGSFFTAAPDKIPGTVFHYDTAAAHVLAALCEKLAGCPMMDFLRASMPELGLSRKSYMLLDGQGVSMGGTGLMATTEDLLRIGILLMNQGAYAGKQLISKEFVKAATSNLTPTLLNAPIASEACGYGYMIWQTEKQGFVCYGMGGQFILVHPEKKLILVTTSDTQGFAGGNQILYDAFYETIYNTLSDAPLSENPESLKALRDLETANTLKPISECLVGSTAATARALGNCRPCKNARFYFPENKAEWNALTLSTGEKGGILTLTDSTRKFTFTFSYDSQTTGTLEKYDTPYAGSGVWLSEDTLYLRFQLLGESVGSIHMELVFTPDNLVLTMRKIEETMFGEFQGTYVCRQSLLS